MAVGNHQWPSATAILDAVIAVMIAHQGGWDEALLIAAPLTGLAALLWLANRRANRHLNSVVEQPDTIAAPDESGSATDTPIQP